MSRRARAAEIWPLVHDERAALVSTLETLSPAQWQSPSLCAGWSVHDVAAHLLDNADANLWALVRGMVEARFDFERMNALGVARHRDASPEEMLAGLRERTSRTRTPPIDLASRLVEEVVHGEDVRRPLGIVRHYPLAAVLLALEYQLRTPESVGGGKERAAGFALAASDADFAHGSGTPVRAPALDLLLAASGRLEFAGMT